jgi:hypothetical protein
LIFTQLPSLSLSLSPTHNPPEIVVVFLGKSNKLPKGGIPKAATTDAGGSKMQEDIATEEKRLAELGSPMALCTLSIP